ncbi:MAG: 16S rRNA processing protein RimM [Ignavibacteriae bacterium]|nr:16S rRNA processing protein RimM [Ignavibacteriota bacterium]
MQKEKYISIGKITKAIGLKGYVKVLVLTDFPERYSDLGKARLYSEKEDRLLTNSHTGKDEFIVNDVIFERDFVKIQFRDFEDINLTGSLIGCIIVIDESERKELEDGRYYFYEMVGMDIINEGKKIGRLETIENYGAQDLLKIRLDENNKEVLIPFIEDFIKNVDTKERKVYIEVIDGMLS